MNNRASNKRETGANLGIGENDPHNRPAKNQNPIHDSASPRRTAGHPCHDTQEMGEARKDSGRPHRRPDQIRSRSRRGLAPWALALNDRKPTASLAKHIYQYRLQPGSPIVPQGLVKLPRAAGIELPMY